MRLYGLILGIVLIISCVVVFKYLWTSDSKLRTMLINLSIVTIVSLYCLLGIELYFRFFFMQSDSFGITHASVRWANKYMHYNSLGFRDTEHRISSLKGKKVVFVVGDSFVVGQGVEDIKDRFANVMQSKLGKDWKVVVVARCSIATEVELNLLREYPYKTPHTIVLSYYINDIDAIAQKKGKPLPNLYEPPPKIIRYLVNRSYAFNFLYWRVYRLTHVDMGKAFWKWLQNSYSDEEIWSAHKKELLAIVDYAKQRKIRLVVAVFPNLAAVEPSKVITSRVINFLKDSNVEVIDLSKELKFSERKTSELVINPADSHPSLDVHREVGELLAKTLLADASINNSRQ